MANHIIGRKLGMTQVYNDAGRIIPVTIVEAGPCPVVAVKQKSILVGYGDTKEKALSKPVLGIFKKSGITPKRLLKELPKEEGREYKIGEILKVDMFTGNDKVDVTGVSIGKGFQGGMKRWHWQGGPGTHGSTSHRRAGSIGSSTSPGRVFKGHHMPGHMGNRKVTVLGLRVVKIDPENNLIAIKGAIPGAKNGYVVVRKTIKKARLVIAPVIAQQKAEAGKKDAKKQAAAKK